MKLIKLDAIDSTNRFLKDLAKNSELENYTTVVAEEQFSGKGQMDTKWHSTKGKNLLFTIYVKFDGLSLDNAAHLNFLTASIIREELKKYCTNKGKIAIKWPNDILSFNNKIAGVLVENIIKDGLIDASLIGVGLNVNETNFPDYLPKASSLAKVLGSECDKEAVLTQIVNAFSKKMTSIYIAENKIQIKENYLKDLYKFNTPTMFKDKEGSVFMGRIETVTHDGLLVVEKQDELLYKYAVKEITFL
ncbi:biotin--[acetyl-CoA-carboxylase] ligase [Flavobacteriaceae bacterium]|nr:biotin--[acetyl-CoA-carboxylase] ligase [Flavobacteriaceae bacterium]